MELNEAIGIVRRDIKENWHFGSLSQFFVSLLIKEIEENTELNNKDAHQLAIKCVKALGM